MDFISSRAMEVTTLALNGLSARHKVLSANVANADTAGYKRADVSFEDQLSKILGNGTLNQNTSNTDSRQLNTLGINFIPDSLAGSASENIFIEKSSHDIDAKLNSFSPEYIVDDKTPSKPDGNNVNIEYEMAQLSKNGMKYSALSTLQAKMFRGIQEAIKG